MRDHEQTVRAPAVRSVNGACVRRGELAVYVKARRLPDVYLGPVRDEKGSVGLF
jgi:hypothetical protein